MNREIKLKSRYNFWEHPIKWFKDREKIKLAELLVNHEWEKGLKHEVELMRLDLMLNGVSFFDEKTGKRIPPTDILK